MTDVCPWPFTLEGIEEPRRGFDALRERSPLQPLDEFGVWVATSHRTVTALLRDSRCATPSAPSGPERGGGTAGGTDAGEPVRRTLARMAVLSDPPEHHARRLPLQRAFAPEVVEQARTRVRAHAVQLLDGLDPPADLVGSFARPLFDRAFDDLLRLPDGTAGQVRRAWKRVSTVVDHPEIEITADISDVVLAVHTLLAAHLNAARAEPRRGADAAPIDVLVATADTEVDTSDAELVANLILAMSSGHRSATQALALAVRTLALHPDQYARLRADPALLPHAVEELLRWDGSVQFTNRVVREDLELDGCAIPGGSVVTLALGGANHDPAMFPDDALDVGATRRPHLSFGRGPHYCPGAPLARLALAEALGVLTERVERLSLAEPPTFTAARRGLDSLMVIW